jgi:hypothetical protein
VITTGNNVFAQPALTGATARVNGTVNGVAVDLNQFNNQFKDVLFVVAIGTITDGNHVLSIEESDVSGSGYAAVDASRVQGTAPTLTSANSNTVAQVGARPTKRYVRLVSTITGTTTGGVYMAVAVCGNGNAHPVLRS